jgi:hypothetical protein
MFPAASVWDWARRWSGVFTAQAAEGSFSLGLLDGTGLLPLNADLR